MAMIIVLCLWTEVVDGFLRPHVHYTYKIYKYKYKILKFLKYTNILYFEIPKKHIA